MVVVGQLCLVTRDTTEASSAIIVQPSLCSPGCPSRRDPGGASGPARLTRLSVFTAHRKD